MKIKKNYLKKLAALLAISITACSIPIGDLFNRDIVLAAEEEKVAYGDVNSDGTIDIFDMVTLKSHLMTGNTSGFSVAAADLDEDGDVSVRDSIELAMYLMNCIGTFTYELKLDTDEDGLSDYIEKEITLTDYLKPDTDGDGLLDDYTEVYLLKTDPLNKYTNGSKISDVDLDADSDGLKNGEELKYGTDLVLADTDEDCISDYDEIYGKVKSDPLKQDSDDDGISDFGELKLSLNPMIKKSDGLTLDSERYFQQELPEENLKDINTDENFYKLSVSAKMRGYAPETLSVRESVYSNLFDEYAVNGKIIDVVCPDEYKDSTGNFKLDLKFELKEGSNPEDYMIFKYVEDYYVLLPAETQWNGNILSLSDAGDGTYCIVDLNEINLEDLSNVSSDIENFNNEVVKSAMPADVNSDGIDLENLEILSDSEKVTASKSVSYTCIFNLGSSFKVGFWNAGVRDAVEGSVKKLFDNGYATSVTLIFKGSYGSGYYTVSINCTSLDDVKKLCNEATSFFSKNIDGNNASQEYTKVNANLGGKLRLSYSKLNYSSYVSSPTPVFVFNDVVSGAVCRFRSGGAACSVLKANTVINSIGANGAQKIYDIVTEGDGKTAYTASFLGKFFMGTKLTAQMVNAYKSNPQLTSAERKTLGFMDTDNDEIDDALEIAMNLIKVVGGKVVFPSFGEAAKNISVFTKGLELFAQKKALEYDDVKAIQYLPQKSAVNNPDTDGDGIEDAFDAEFLKKLNYMFTHIEDYDTKKAEDLMSKGYRNLISEGEARYNTKKATAADYVNVAKVMAIAFGGNTHFGALAEGIEWPPNLETLKLGPLPTASKTMGHFGMNTGSDLVVDFPVAVGLTMTQRFNYYKHMNLFMEMAESTVNEGYTYEFSTISDAIDEDRYWINDFGERAALTHEIGLDWFYGVGGVQNALAAKVKCEKDANGMINYSAKIKYYLIDYYDWKGNTESLDSLHDCGLAKNFRTFGEYETTVKWAANSRFPNVYAAQIDLSQNNFKGISDTNLQKAYEDGIEYYKQARRRLLPVGLW